MSQKIGARLGISLVLVLTLAGGARAAVPSAPSPDAGVDAARLLEAARVPTCVCEEQRRSSRATATRSPLRRPSKRRARRRPGRAGSRGARSPGRAS
jgi:hypothetical protein